MIATLPEIDRSDCVRVTQRDGEAFLFHAGEQFVWEGLPAGTRVIYPPQPLPAIDDVDAAIEQALENPLGADPLSAQLRPGMRLTIAFDDVSLPLPPMRTPDVRQRVIERSSTSCAASGVDDVHLICAIALHRKMTGPELREVLGAKVYDEFAPKGRLYNHDAEDPAGVVLLGKTDNDEEVWINKRVADSDLLVYVNINLVTMDGGHKSINTGLTTYRTIRHHHNVHTLMNCKSYMDPRASMLHALASAWAASSPRTSRASTSRRRSTPTRSRRCSATFRSRNPPGTPGTRSTSTPTASASRCFPTSCAAASG